MKAECVKNDIVSHKKDHTYQQNEINPLRIIQQTSLSLNERK